MEATLPAEEETQEACIDNQKIKCACFVFNGNTIGELDPKELEKFHVYQIISRAKCI